MPLKLPVKPPAPARESPFRVRSLSSATAGLNSLQARKPACLILRLFTLAAQKEEQIPPENAPRAHGRGVIATQRRIGAHLVNSSISVFLPSSATIWKTCLPPRSLRPR
jgi:hypothetical protein